MRNEIERDKRSVSVTTPSEERPSLHRCAKILEYVKNRNRVAPARIRLADCDFFVVGPRRTLRVLVPRRGGHSSYETGTATAPRLDADRYFPSSCEASDTSGDPHRSGFKLTNVSDLGTDERLKNERIEDPPPPSSRVADKNKIVKNLEEYIERLLREVLSDTMRFFDDQGEQHHPQHEKRERKSPEAIAEPPNESADARTDGYTNRGFDASPTDPDSLDFRIEPKSTNENEYFDCTDSGINSVETTELFQISPQELTLEQSLMEIMDAKLSEVSSERDRTMAKPDAMHDPASLAASDATASAPLSLIDGDEEKVFQRSAPTTEDRPESPTAPPTVIDTTVETKTETLREKLTRRFVRKCRRRDDKDETAATTRDDSATASPRPATAHRRVKRVRKPLLVFLHGFGSSAQVFHHQLEYFSNLGYPCVAPELLGHGMSSAPDRPRDYRFDKLLRDLETVLHHYRAFAPGNKCVLVAHNYGCSFASALASKYERNVDRLVLISGGGPTPLAPPSTEGPGRCCLRALLTPLLVCGLRRDILYSARGRQHPYRGSETIEQRPSHMRYVLDGMIWPEGDCVFHRRIAAPTLLIHGLRDDEVSLVQECQMERTIIKAFLDAIPAAGHTPMIDSPERVNHAIHCFVDMSKRKRR